jgi:hypothetical protein
LVCLFILSIKINAANGIFPFIFSLRKNISQIMEDDFIKYICDIRITMSLIHKEEGKDVKDG